jgi:hypothetical protein
LKVSKYFNPFCVSVKKGCNVESNGRVDSCTSSKNIASEENQSSYMENRRKRGENGMCVQGNDPRSRIDNSIQSTYNPVAAALAATVPYPAGLADYTFSRAKCGGEK